MMTTTMTNDEIIRMAREAGLPVNIDGMTLIPLIERFAALVAEPWIETNKALAKEIIELKKQAEQEPVAKLIEMSKANFERHWGRNDFADWIYSDIADLFSEYAAPAHTKDLTDDEVAKAYMECTGGDIIARCRAVIAAYKEKNK